MITILLAVLSAAPCDTREAQSPDERLELRLSCDRDAVLDQPMDLSGLTKEALRRLRNAYFARRGLKFKSKELAFYFGRFSWYAPTSDNVDALLTAEDQRNLAQLQTAERLQTMLAAAGAWTWSWYDPDGGSSGQQTVLCADGRAFRTFEGSDVLDLLWWGRWSYRSADQVDIRWTRRSGKRGSGEGRAVANSTMYERYLAFDEHLDETESNSMLLALAPDGGPLDAKGLEGSAVKAGAKYQFEVCTSEKTSKWKGEAPARK